MPYIGNPISDFNVSTAMLNTDSVTSIKIDDGTIVNADINDSAAIAMSKLALSITNSEVNASAAIAGSKISPDFGSQTVTSSYLTLSAVNPNISFTDSNDNPDFKLEANSGQFKIIDSTNSADRLIVQSDGTIDVEGNLDANGGLDVTGAIAATGNITSSAGEISTTNGSVIANKGTNNQVILGHDGAVEISRNGGGAFIDFKNDPSEDHDARIQENSGGFDISGNVNIANGLDITGAITGTGDLTLSSGGANRLQMTSPGGGVFLIKNPSAAALAFGANNAENMRIDSSGRVGINQTSFATSDTMLSISETSGHCEIGIISKNDSGAVINMGDPDSYNQGRIKYDNSDNSLTFRTSASDALSIDSSGRVGIGHDTPSSFSSGAHTLVLNTTSGNCGITISTGAADQIGSIFFAEGTGSTGDGRIRYEHANNAMAFSTADTERMRIDSSGKISIGSTATDTGVLVIDKNITAESDASDTANYHLVIRSKSNSNTSKVGIAFKNTSESVHVGAAILHHRTGGDSVGDLAFYTSPSSGTTTERTKITSVGTLLHGSGAIATQKATNGGLDIAANGHSIVFGADSNAGNVTQARTNNAAKDQRISAVHYTNAEEPIGVVRVYSDSTTNQLFWGGGSSLFNSATEQTFYTAANNTTTNGTERLKIHSNGTVNIPGGITLGQTINSVAASNRLDDYEEGTWSPSGSWTTITASYTKIGRMVYAGFSLRANTADGSNVTIGSLPFTSGSTHGHCGGIVWGLCEFNAGDGWLNGSIGDGETSVTVRRNSATVVTFGSGQNNMNQNAFLRGMVVYMTA